MSIDGKEMMDKMAMQIATDGMPANFTFLADPGHKVIDRYGLLNPAGQGWPHPTVYVIDRTGVVRWKFTEVNYRIRPTNAMILAALDAVRGDG